MIETVYKIKNAPHIALLADLHNRPYDAILASLRSHHPDLIALAGDFLYGGAPVDDRSPLEEQNALPFLEACAAIAPTYLSLGNHEWMLDGDDLEEMRGSGVVVLDNEWTTTEVDGRKIILGGLTSGYVMDYRRFKASQSDHTVRYPKQTRSSTPPTHEPDLSWLPGFEREAGYHILLAHEPHLWPGISHYNIDLCLSGHTHGGQWRIFNRGVFAPGQGFWPRYSKGVYDGRLVISAGLSNTSWVPRLFNPCELVMIEPE